MGGSREHKKTLLQWVYSKRLVEFSLSEQPENSNMGEKQEGKEHKVAQRRMTNGYRPLLPPTGEGVQAIYNQTETKTILSRLFKFLDIMHFM